jgi:MFS family permease
MMSGFHGFFSLGILLGAFTTSLFLQWQINFFINTLVYVLFLFPLTFIFAYYLDNDEKVLEKGKTNIFFVWPILIFLLVLLSIANALAEGGVDSWGALYMRDVVGVSGFKIGIATISFNFFMVIGRFAGDKLRDIIGVFLYLLILMFLTLFGLIILFNFNTLQSSVIGFCTLGMGASSIVPIAYSLAGKVKGIDSAVGITIISISVYGVFMIAPALLGLIANNFGISFIYLPMIILFFICFVIVSLCKKIFII